MDHLYHHAKFGGIRTMHVGVRGRNVVFFTLFVSIFYRQDLPEGQLCRYCFYSRVDFRVFRPAGATCCTDQGEIWHGGAEHLYVLCASSVPNFTLIGSGVGVYGPQN